MSATQAVPVLRCYDSITALESLVALFRVAPDDLAAALPLAARAAEADQHTPYPAKLLVPALAAALGRPPAAPSRIHCFHRTRIFDPDEIVQHGLLPLSQLIDGLWDRMGQLAPEVAPERFAALRRTVEEGHVDALSYRARMKLATRDDGPHGALVRDVLLDPSSNFVRIPENICFAARGVLGVDLEPRYERVTMSCIVEFSVAPDDLDQALAAACWYVEATLRDGADPTAGDTHWNYNGNGVAVPPGDIVAVETLDPRHDGA
jgi:hypothetical protein